MTSLTRDNVHRARVQVACINWIHPDAPKAMTYVHVDGDMVVDVYHSTWAQAVRFAQHWAGQLRRAAARAGVS